MQTIASEYIQQISYLTAENKIHIILINKHYTAIFIILHNL